ncbi:hypothetical protein OO007_05640 [Cocleimonas sp. KMM 6892]|uniref:hypothetical protein n=1 Tax=unclassified Cocleimonas TaxID=2639732 RepID=UPI002DBAE51C|nr:MULTISPECIES: hypothetical protein [unclassified Cocleimonas]MEB8431702.1 hypothetical protein [Cocleimonas sp. KMM 6892]MEC4715212.1 hypothetical protein [Cocleimonas sp. KMM 6895]MEC4743974.1 hypothetical protein [Cocleimonas sp. KMM 6896]
MFNYSLLNAAAVPTLSGMMLFILSLLLFFVAFKVSKQKSANTGKFFITLIGVGALVSGMGGVKLISDVSAVGYASLPIVGSKGSVTLNPNGTSIFQNQDGAQRTLVAGKIDLSGFPEGAFCKSILQDVTPNTTDTFNYNPCNEGDHIPFNAVCRFECSSSGGVQ